MTRSRNADFYCAVVIVGLLAGCAGLATTFLLRSIEHLTYHYTFGSLLEGVTASSPVRQAVGPTIGGALAGLGWWILRSRTEVAPLAAAVAHRDRIRLLPFTFDAALQVLVVGSGASLGREVAPRQFAVALSNLVIGWVKRLSERDREILLACAAGAGLGAVYAVPLGGAVFTLRIMLKTWRPRAIGAALITSSLAVSVSSFITHDQPNLHWPDPDVSYRLIGYALALAPLSLLVGLLFNRLMGWAGQRDVPKSWLLIPGIAAAGLLVGVCSHWWPELPGNGRSILNVILAGGMTLNTAAIVLVLKLVVTAAFLRVGARGGLFTPALATGAAAGTLFVLTINAIAGTHYGVPAVALAGSAGVLAITQNAPLWAAIFVWELARPPLWLLLVFLVAALSTYGLRKMLLRNG
ncbi:chloride channel protein [Candidatus Mycobacterium wuenschmannii]|uniref:Chloride channel protein n=1 Tax=Candidatus Mycobacterium wuenschmannii TaxID=3027808 RepID=A0ABY8VY35_9MYCO|nr:chloride channel protein [Candidatus Mycobacterium wuenschmannii]WIM87053.1 chloride channel protein [Candidatus Mycobacterium wuenschmannii]